MGTSLGMSFSSILSRKISVHVGRMQTIIGFAWTGISCLTLMAIQKKWWTEAHVIIPIYVLRTILMNSCGALRSSVLMDYVSKKNRAKWNSLDSVRKFGWSGSAVVGGILV